MAARVVRNCFDKYQKARLEYVTDICDMAEKPHYLESLLDEGAVVELKKLLHDRLPTVQQLSALALGRLASYSSELATELVTSDVLSELTDSMASEDVSIHHLKASAFVIRAVAKHNEQLAQCCVEAGGAAVLVHSLENLDAGVRESSALSLGVLARHTPHLAEAVVEAGAVHYLVVCAREPVLPLKRACISALSDIAKHSPELAMAVTQAQLLPMLAAMLSSTDTKLKRHTSNCIAQLVKHDVHLAEAAVEAGIFPELLVLMQDPDVHVRQNAAAAVREVVKHSEELAALVVKANGLGFMVDYMGDCHGNARLPAVMALGFVASYSETLGMAVIQSNGITVLKDCLVHEPEDHLKAAAVWSLGQCGRHGVEHSQLIAEADCLRHILAAMLHEEASDDLRSKAQKTLRVTLARCRHLAAMQPLLPLAPVGTLQLLLSRFVEVLPEDQAQRRALVANGGLKLVQSLDRGDGTVAQLVDLINENFPAEVVEYCSPDFAVNLAKRVEEQTASGMGQLRQEQRVAKEALRSESKVE